MQTPPFYTYTPEGVHINRLIDDIDAKIIKDLLINARKSFVDIASECQVSTATISDHFTELENAGIIIGSTVQVNHKAMGHKAISNVLVNIDQKGAEEVIEFIKKLPYETSLIALAPKNTISLVVGLNDIREVGKFKESIKRNKYVADVKVEVWIDVKNMPERLRITDNAQLEKAVDLIEDHKTDYELDEIDRQLIEKLLQNSMQPFGKIAIEIGTSLNTVARKYKKLAETGIIRPVIQLNLPKIGYHAVLVFSIGFGPEVTPNDVIKELFTIKDSFLMIKTSGEYDLSAFFMLKDLNQLLDVQKQVTRIHGIAKTDMKIYPVLVPWPAVGEFISTL